MLYPAFHLKPKEADISEPFNTEQSNGVSASPGGPLRSIERVELVSSQQLPLPIKIKPRHTDEAADTNKSSRKHQTLTKKKDCIYGSQMYSERAVTASN